METVLMDYGKYLTLESATGVDAGVEYDEEVQRIKNIAEYRYIVTVDDKEHVLTIDAKGNFVLTPPLDK
jgi:hypothetical protein